MEGIKESFRGIVLTDEQMQGLKDNMRSVLGEEYYALTEGLFFDALNSRARYIVFLARRCFNLMNLYYRANYKVPDINYEQRVLSDSGLLANVPSVAYRYIALGSIPDILIVDDILIHGRGINKLIDDFIDSLKKFMDSRGFEYSSEDLEREVVKSITIRVMVQNNKPLLMNSSYYQRLLVDGYKPNIWEPRRWHELSSCISRLVSESIFSNTSFTLSLYSDNESDVKNSVEEAAKRLGFIKSSWSKRFVSDAWVKPLKRKDGDISAFYTLRITQNMIDDSICVVPFVFASGIDFNFSEILFKKLFDENTENLIFSSHLPEKVSAEFIYLVLSYNLLLLIQEDCKISNLITINKLDIDKIILNFGKDTIFASGINELLKLNAPLLNWEEMNSYLLASTSNSKPLIDGICESKTTVYHNVGEALEEIVANEGEEIEKIAYLEYSGQKSTTKKTKLNPIYNLFYDVVSKTNLSNDNDIADLVGNFLRQMDRGYVAVTTQILEDNELKYISCVYRAAEASHFIHSKKYSDYLPVLIEMESDCSYNCDRIIERINRFFEDKPDVKTKLEDYTKALYESGQKLIDWDINWLHWTEVDDDTVRIFGNQSRDDLLISQMILKSLNNAESLKKYRAVYPKH